MGRRLLAWRTPTRASAGRGTLNVSQPSGFARRAAAASEFQFPADERWPVRTPARPGQGPTRPNTKRGAARPRPAGMMEVGVACPSVARVLRCPRPRLDSLALSAALAMHCQCGGTASGSCGGPGEGFTLRLQLRWTRRDTALASNRVRAADLRAGQPGRAWTAGRLQVCRTRKCMGSGWQE